MQAISSARRRGAWGRVALVVLAVATLAGCNSVWAQWRSGPERHGFNPDETAIGPDNVASLTVKWERLGPGQPPPLHGMGAITAADDLAFVARPDGTVSALEAATGVTRWSYTSGLVKEIAYAGGIVYFSSANRHVQALDAETGSLVWRTPVLPDPGPATVVGETVLVIGSDRYLYTFDRQTGARLSEVRLAEQGRFAVDTADGDLYVVSTGATPAGEFLHAYTATGTLRWVATVPISGTPVVADGHVYLRGQAFDADTGDPVWTEVGSAFASSPAVAYGNVYVARSFGAPLVALDPATGHVRWSAVAGTSFPANDDGAAVAGDIVWVHADRTLKAFDAHTGAALWSATAPFELSDSRMPVVAGGQVYSESQDGTRLVAFGLP
jgi:outer membrane protein assembly factor BamB